MNAGKFLLGVAQALTIAGIIAIFRAQSQTAIDVAVLKEHVCKCGQERSVAANPKTEKHEN